MATPTRKLPFRKGQSYTGANRCVLCGHLEPFHHGFCNGSVGAPAMADAVASLVGMDVCRFEMDRVCITCERIGAAVGDSLATRPTPDNGSAASEEPGRLEWTQEGVPGHWLCGKCGDGAGNATWWKGRRPSGALASGLGRCDKHAPNVEPPSRPGWVKHEIGDHHHVHASKAKVYMHLKYGWSWAAPGEAARKIGRVESLEAAFAAAEQAIEDNQWTPDGVNGIADPAAQTYKLANGTFVAKRDGLWLYATGIACAYNIVGSMVEAFALAEAAR